MAAVKKNPSSDNPLDAHHPRLTKCLYGHDSLLNALQNAWNQGRFPHGIILSGPKGIGKSTLSYHIARHLLSLEPALKNHKINLLNRDDNQNSKTAHLIRAENHPELLVISKNVDDKGKQSKDISIEKARSVVQFFAQTSLENKWRIAIVDTVDDLTIKGANALLKILEEPPKKCILILLSENSTGVLPTLKSRTQIFNCAPLNIENSQAVFKDHSIEDADFYGTVCCGRPGLGFDIRDLGGLEFYKNFLDTMAAIANQDFRNTQSFIETYITKSKEISPDLALERFKNFLIHWCANALSKTQKKQAWGTKGEAQIANYIFQKRVPDDFVDSWFLGQNLLKQSHVFALDKKQALLCLFYELGGYYKR